MKFRFLKKLNGDKVLQVSTGECQDYMDVPMVEEKPSAKDRLFKAISKAKLAGYEFDITILVNKKFHDELVQGCSYMESFSMREPICSFYGRKLFIVDMKRDFKIVKEIYND